MGHDIHFLSRLERLSLPHVELAMSLYNDTPLLHYILSALKLPDGVERIALSLGDATDGPFLIVQRAGHFVTCLGQGMAPVGLHVVPRSQLEALSHRVGELRKRMELARKQIGPSGHAVDLFRPLFTCGQNLSREEFVAAAAWAPMLQHQLIGLISDAHSDVRQAYYALRSKHKRRAIDPSFLRSYWNTIWAIGHLSLLLGMEGRPICEVVIEDGQMADALAKLSWPAVRQGICGPALRGAWAAAKLGKVVLAGYKAEYARGGSDLAFFSVTLSLFGMARRHKGLRGEIKKTLERTEPTLAAGYQGLLYQTYPPHLAELLTANLQLADDDPAALNRYGQDLYAELVNRRLPADSAFRYGDASAVPPELAAAAVAMLPGNMLMEPARFHEMLTLSVWLSGFDAESFYFPRQLLQEFRFPVAPLYVNTQIEQMQKLYDETTPVRATPKAGRNEPCPCGSGVKYKKCCALTGGVQDSASG
jgi:hypothetical protein